MYQKHYSFLAPEHAAEMREFLNEAEVNFQACNVITIPLKTAPENNQPPPLLLRSLNLLPPSL